MTLYTRAGDDGCTNLIGKNGVPKNNVRVSAYGDLDELNATLGVAIAACKVGETCERLETIQRDLFQIGVQLATCAGQAPACSVEDQQIRQIEEWTDSAELQISPLRNFVLPGGTESASRLHLARTVCRRVERSVVNLAQQEEVPRTVVAYLNRLGDLFFALARLENHHAGIDERPWPSSKGPQRTDSSNGTQRE